MKTSQEVLNEALAVLKENGCFGGIVVIDPINENEGSFSFSWPENNVVRVRKTEQYEKDGVVSSERVEFNRDSEMSERKSMLNRAGSVLHGLNILKKQASNLVTLLNESYLC